MTAAFDPAAKGWTIRDDEPGFIDLVGPLWQHGEGESIAFGIVVQEKHLNRRNVVHGGMIMTFADQALGLTAREVTGGLAQATIQLDTHFIAPAVAGEFISVKAEVVRRTPLHPVYEGNAERRGARHRILAGNLEDALESLRTSCLLRSDRCGPARQDPKCLI